MIVFVLLVLKPEVAFQYVPFHLHLDLQPLWIVGSHLIFAVQRSFSFYVIGKTSKIKKINGCTSGLRAASSATGRCPSSSKDSICLILVR